VPDRKQTIEHTRFALPQGNMSLPFVSVSLCRTFRPLPPPRRLSKTSSFGGFPELHTCRSAPRPTRRHLWRRSRVCQRARAQSRLSVDDSLDILNIESIADVAELRRAYYGRIRELHPDLNPDRDTTDEAAQVNEAYAVLLEVRVVVYIILYV
jgi:hypothetical protein